MSPTAGRWFVVGLLACAIGSLWGCAAPLPVYRIEDPDRALRTIAERTAKIHTLSGPATVRLTDADHQTLVLDAALAAAPPDRLRLRAWKMGAAVLDATLVRGEVWIAASSDPRASHARDAAGAVADGLATAIELLSPRFYADARVIGRPRAGGTLRVLGETPRGPLICEIDLATLTPLRFYPPGPGERGPRIEMGRYRLIGGVPWATRLTLVSDSGSVEVRTGGVEINAELPESAFVPPLRAERRR